MYLVFKQTFFNMIISFCWDLIETHQENWLSLVIENAIRKFCSMFTLWSIWIFFYCGQLLVIYHKNISKELTQMVTTGIREKENLWFLLSHFSVLGQAKRHLFKNLQMMLITNCFLSVVNMLTCSYYTIEFMASPYWIGTWWDLSDVLEFTFRLWLICHTADQIRSSVCLFSMYLLADLYLVLKPSPILLVAIAFIFIRLLGRRLHSSLA